MKIETKKHLTNNEKIKRKEIKEDIMNSDKSKLLPDESFSEDEKEVFNYIIDNSPTLANIDIFAVNSYVRALSDIKLANEHFEKEGKIVNGKLNPYYRVYNDAFKVTSNLADKLNMTPMARAKHGLKLSNNKDSYDPIKKLMNDNE